MFVYYNGVKIVRAPAAGNSDGSLVMSADIPVGESRLNDRNGVRGSVSDWKMNADMDMYRKKDEFYKENKLRKR